MVTPDCGLTMFLPGSHRLTDEPVVPAGAIDPLGAVTPDITGTDAVLFENRTWHTGGINLSGRPRIALMLQYGYRWLRPVDDPATELRADPALTSIEQQLLGLPDRHPDGSLAEGSGAAPMRSWWQSGPSVAARTRGKPQRPTGTSSTREHDIVSESTAVLLIGITGSGKTHLAQALSARGIVRLSVDEEVHRLHGRYGVDYPEHEYFEREAPAVETVRAQLTELLRAGRSIVLDHGLWRRSDRDEWKKTVRAVGGRPLLVYLPASKEVLLRRLAARSQRRDANALTVTPEALDDFFARFEPPTADEDAVTYNGDVEVIRSMVR
jgi:predicted kinase